MNLSRNARIRLARMGSATLAGSAYSSEVDMQNYQGVCFFGTWKTIAAGSSVDVTAQQSNTSGSSFTDLESTRINNPVANDNYTFLLDIYRPTSRYVRLCLKGQENTASPVGDVYAVAYGARYKGVINSTSGSTEALAASGITAEFHAGPAEGTA